MLIVAFDSLEDMLRLAYPLRQKCSYVQVRDVYFRGSSPDDFVMYLLFADCPSSEADSSACGMDSVKIPIEQSHWGSYFDRIYEFCESHCLAQVRIDNLTPSTDVCPGDGDVFFDSNYCRWIVRSHDLDESFASEAGSGYDWEVVALEEAAEDGKGAGGDESTETDDMPDSATAAVSARAELESPEPSIMHGFMKAVQQLTFGAAAAAGASASVGVSPSPCAASAGRGQKRTLELTATAGIVSQGNSWTAAGSGGTTSNTTYKDVVLKLKEKEEEERLVKAFAATVGVDELDGGAPSSSGSGSGRGRQWRPQIQVCELSGNQRVDRAYYEQAQVKEAADRAAMQSALDNGLWGLVDAVQQCKAARSVSRVRGFTKLKPAAMAKKIARIAQKRKQQLNS